MITYLQNGWYAGNEHERLCDDVIDGAIDAASMLYRAGVPADALARLALKVRTLSAIAGRTLGTTPQPHTGPFQASQQAALVQHVMPYTDTFPPLQGFVTDCLEHIADIHDLRAFYLHLVHIGQMMQLLAVASDVEPSPSSRDALPNGKPRKKKS